MMKLSEKVKKGITHCIESKACIECPYDGRDFPRCFVRIGKDVLSYIRELEARLAEYEKPLRPMTLDEVVEKSKRVNDNVIWLERPDEEYGYDDAECIPALVSNRSRIGADYIQYVRFLAWPKQEIFFDISDEDKEDYGRTWRCWSRRPTDDEREAAERDV